MKKILFFLLTIIAFNAFSQKILNEMAVTYEIKDVKSKNAKNAMATRTLSGTTMTMFYSKDNQKMEMDMMQGLMKMRMFMNPKEKTMRSFMDMMGQKVEMIGMDSTYKYTLEHPAETKQVEPPKATGKTKEIMGYKCEEYISKVTKENVEMTTSMYITKELKVDKSIWTNSSAANSMMPAMPDGSQVDGFPLEIMVDNPEFTMTMLVTDLKETLNKDEFKIPEGYKPMDMKKMKGMKGGGF